MRRWGGQPMPFRLTDLPFVIGAVDVPGGTFAGDDPTRHADHHAVVGNVHRDHAIRADGDVVADAHAAGDDGAGTDVDAVAQDRIALVAPAVRPADGHALRDVAV